MLYLVKLMYYIFYMSKNILGYITQKHTFTLYIYINIRPSIKDIILMMMQVLFRNETGCFVKLILKLHLFVLLDESLNY